METTTRVWTLEQLAKILGGTLHGPKDRTILRPVPAGFSDPDGITFAESIEYLTKALGTTIGAVLVPTGTPPQEIATICVDRPRVSFGRVLGLYQRPLPIEPGIHPTAIVSPQAVISPSASIGAYAVIEKGVTIGDETKVYPFAYIGDGCQLGCRVIVYPHAVLYQDVIVGDRSIIHSGSIIGADGFGFLWDSKDRNYRVKVPQVGGVHIGRDVEVGALVAIDRATAGNTVIQEGTKLDNFVQIGHNCVVGAHTVIAGQTAMGGSSSVGSRNDVGGQSAISDHVSVGDDIILAGRTGVTNTLNEPGPYWGTPARPLGLAKRLVALIGKLPELHRTVKDLEKRMAQLEQDKP